MRKVNRLIRKVATPVWRRARGIYLDVRFSLESALGQRRTALASYPRSGNTLVRALLEEVTGEATGSIYHDVVMPRNDTGLVIKTHALDGHRYADAIHVVRDPLDVVISYFHWQRDIAGVEPCWDDHLVETARAWAHHTAHWLDFQGDRYQVRYEDLRESPGAVLGELLSWMGRPASAGTIQRAVHRTSLGEMRTRTGGRIGKRFFREGTSGQYRTALSHEDVMHALDIVGNLRRSLGYRDIGDA